MALPLPEKKPLRATQIGTYHLKIAIRQDLYVDDVRETLAAFGELISWEPYSAHVQVEPLYDPLEVLQYINSFTDADFEAPEQTCLCSDHSCSCTAQTQLLETN